MVCMQYRVRVLSFQLLYTALYTRIRLLCCLSGGAVANNSSLPFQPGTHHVSLSVGLQA
jgi:hypothetical protein